jgi:phosphatidate cytidylyltransferase
LLFGVSFLPVQTTPFMAFAGAIVVIGAWEWTALMRLDKRASPFSLRFSGCVRLVAINTPQLAFIKQPLYAISAGFWLIAFALGGFIS